MLSLAEKHDAVTARYNAAHVWIGEILPAIEKAARDPVLRLLAYLNRESCAVAHAIKRDRKTLPSAAAALEATAVPGVAYFDPTGTTREIVFGRGQFSQREFLGLYNAALPEAGKSNLSRILVGRLEKLRKARELWLNLSVKYAEALPGDDVRRSPKKQVGDPKVSRTREDRPRPAASPAKRKRTCNEAIRLLIQERPEAKGWTVRKFRAETGYAVGTIGETEIFKRLAQFREVNRATRAATKFQISKGKRKSVR